MSNYTTVSTCQYNGRIYSAGEKLIYDKEVVVCPDCKGKKQEAVCKLCKDSGRIVPPHHFKRIGEENAKEKTEGEKILDDKDIYKEAREATKKEIEQIRAEIKRLGGSFNGTWGLERLKMYLIKVQKEYGEKNVL